MNNFYYGSFNSQVITISPKTNAFSPKIIITQQNLNSQADLPKIETALDAGQILFLNTQKFFQAHQEDVVTLKSTIDELKKICARKGGNLGRIGEDILVISPHKNIRMF